MQYSVWNDKLVKDYEKITNGICDCMITSNDDKYLFVSDDNTNLTKIDLKNQNQTHKFGKLVEGNIIYMFQCKDNNFLYAVDCLGIIYEILIEENKINRKFKNIGNYISIAVY